MQSGYIICPSNGEFIWTKSVIIMNTYKLDKGWFLDLKNKKIYKKDIFFISWFFTSLGLFRTDMRSLYTMVVDAHKSAEVNGLGFPLDHDNFLKPTKYPFYFRLNAGWKIEQKSVKFLKNGPLFTEDGTDDIVPAKIFTKSVKLRVCNFVLSSVIAAAVPTIIWWVIDQFYKLIGSFFWP